MECEEKTQDNIQLRRSLSNIKADHEKVRKDLNDSALEIDKLKFNAKTQSMKLQDEISKANQSNRSLDQELREKLSYIERVKANTERLNGENIKIRKLNDEQARENSNLREDNKKLKALLSEARAAFDKLNSEVKTLKPKANDLNPQNERLQKFNEDTMKRLSQALESNGKLLQSSEVVREECEEKVRGLASENKRLREEMHDLEVANTKLQVCSSCYL